MLAYLRGHIMEDWQEMLIIILIVLIGMSAYLIYLGYQIHDIQESVASAYQLEGTIGGMQGSGYQVPGQGISPIGIIAKGYSR